MTLVHVADRHTDDQQRFHDNALSDQSLLLVSKGSKVETFSVELTIGDRWSARYDANSNAMFRIEGGESIVVPGHGSIVVEAAEHLHVPHNMYGLVIPTGSLFLDRGVIIAAAKIEPSFNDRLKLRLVNTTGQPQRLKAGDKVASAIFFVTELTRFQPEVRKASADAVIRPPWGSAAVRWVRNNPDKPIGWLVSAVSGGVMALLIGRYLLPA